MSRVQESGSDDDSDDNHDGGDYSRATVRAAAAWDDDSRMLIAECAACPAGGDCNAFGLSADGIAVRPGFWRSGNASIDVRSCRAAAACVGSSRLSSSTTNNGTARSQQPFGDVLCRDGHIGPVCYFTPGDAPPPLPLFFFGELTSYLLLFAVLLRLRGRLLQRPGRSLLALLSYYSRVFIQRSRGDARRYNRRWFRPL